MMRTFFDSTAEGMIRYFIRPNDDYVLNSLEKLDCDEYLYRLLKTDGYERIVFFEVDETNCKVYAYDKLSHLSILNPIDFQKVNLKDDNSLSTFFTTVQENREKTTSGPVGLKTTSSRVKENKSVILEYGKREVTRFAQSANFIEVFEKYISNALQADNIKTAIVMHMEIFEQVFNKEINIANKTSAQFVDIIRKNERVNSLKQNIIVFTTTQIDNFYRLLGNNLLHNLHSWIPEVMLEGTSSRERVHKAIELLREYGCLVMVDSIGAGEIANLLLRKKIIEHDQRFSALRVSKIYPVSEALQEHLTQKYEKFPKMIVPYIKRREYIRPLNSMLRRDEVVAAITEYAEKIEAKELKLLNKIGSVYVERVTQVYTKYIEDASVSEIMSELDDLVGMDYLKKQILKTLAKFKKDKSRYDEAVSKGKTPRKFPYMNMVFTGPPGTGKTTVADIVARLFCAEGILTNPEPMFRKPANYPTDGRADVLGGRLGTDLDKGNGGVVVIDEFYNFNRGHSGGNLAEEALSTIMDRTDKYKNTMCLIVAGYEKEMEEMFEFNDGASRRFPYTIKFEPYSTDDLLEIFNKMIGSIVVKDTTMNMVRKIVDAERISHGNTFGNAGFIEDILIPRIEIEYYDRGEEDNEFTETDVENAFPNFKEKDNNKTHYRKVPRTLFSELPGYYEIKEYAYDELNDATENAVLYVKTNTGFGTAFLISPDGYALTCNHVIEGASEINVRLRIYGRLGGSDSWHRCSIINAKNDYDMALIKLEGDTFPHLNIADPEREIKRGEHYMVSGYPFGKKTEKDLTNFYGIIGSGNKQVDSTGLQIYNIDGQAKKGNSGSPVISLEDGRVIGLLCGSITDEGDVLTEEINYIRAIKYFWEEFLK